MNATDIIEETTTALLANKVRSSLTILGIVIGISSVIAMTAIGAGASQTITSSIESLGSNLLQITPGAQATQGFGASSGRGGAQSLVAEDADAISENVAGVAAIATQVSGRYQVTAKGTNTNTSVNGVSSSWTVVRNVEIAEGAFFGETQNTSGAKVAVLGPTTRDDLFGVGAAAVGEVVRINGLQFKVIGVTAAKGGTGFQNQDDIIYIPVRSAQRYLTGSQALNAIAVTTASADEMATVQADITALLRARHNIAEDEEADFSVLNQADILSSASSITATLTYLLAAIGGISLIVGGIGIMNMMLTTVTERTREIGLRKAIGAKRRDISIQFLAEAVALTMIGGVVGILLGWGISFGVNATGLVTTTVTLTSVLLAVGVSGATGIIFGWYPARRAARLNPIEALRYE
ncbi:MAG: ABC transporter permease [Patescibacteria group bacterium]